MKRSIHLAGIALVVLLTPANSDWQDDWKAKWIAEIEAIGTQPKEEQIERLGAAARSKSTNGGYQRPTANQLAVGTRAVEMLVTIPGHGEYFRDKINNARKRMEAAIESGDEGAYNPARLELRDAVESGFLTLAELPSVETVRVLGEFLYDERGYVNVTLEDPSEKQRYESIKHSPVYRKAAKALAALPIVGKLEPPRMELGGPDDTKAWKQWYQEIKDGKRTFRFEGDPVEYDLNGPASKDKVERIARDQKREAERQSGRERISVSPAVAEQATTSSRPMPVSIAILVASIVLLGSIGFYILRKRRHGARR